jgi:hypothetical protein
VFLLILRVFSVEAFDSACGVHQLLFAGEEGMALGTDFQMDFRLRRAGFERFAAGALHDSLDVSRMNVCLHFENSSRPNTYYKANDGNGKRPVVNSPPLAKGAAKGTIDIADAQGCSTLASGDSKLR